MVYNRRDSANGSSRTYTGISAIDQNIVAESFAAGVEELFDMESFKNELLTSEKKYQLSSITEKLSEVTRK